MHGVKKVALRFLAVGILAFLIDYSLTLFLHYTLGIVGYVASGISFTISFLFSFTLSKRWVFQPKATYKYSTKSQVFMYFSLALLNLFVSSAMIAWMSSVGLDVYISKAIAVFLVAMWNFVIGRYVIFAETKTESF
jgi:putative flippase GtrA